MEAFFDIAPLWEIVIFFVLVFALVAIGLLTFYRDNVVRDAIMAEITQSTSEDDVSEQPRWREGFVDRLFWHSFESSSARHFLSGLGLEELRERLHQSGQHNRAAVVTYILWKVVFVCLAVLILAALSLFTRFGSAPLGLRFLIILWFLLIGYFLPNFLLSAKIKRFQDELYRSLPIFLDLITMCLATGHTVENALITVAKAMQRSYPAMAEEIAITGAQLKVAIQREKAWNRLIKHTNVIEIETLAQLFQSHEASGVALTRPLQALAKKVRRRYVHLIERKIERLPYKMLFIVMIFFFPILIILVVAIVYFNIVQQIATINGISQGL